MNNHEGIKIGLEAMRSDAELWKKSAEQLEGPKNTAAALALNPKQTSWMSKQLGLDAELEELRNQIADMIRQASDTFTNISDDLIKAAQQYQDDDDLAKSELEKIEN